MVEAEVTEAVTKEVLAVSGAVTEAVAGINAAELGLSTTGSMVETEDSAGEVVLDA